MVLPRKVFLFRVKQTDVVEIVFSLHLRGLMIALGAHFFHPCSAARRREGGKGALLSNCPRWRRRGRMSDCRCYATTGGKGRWARRGVGTLEGGRASGTYSFPFLGDVHVAGGRKTSLDPPLKFSLGVSARRLIAPILTTCNCMPEID